MQSSKKGVGRETRWVGFIAIGQGKKHDYDKAKAINTNQRGTHNEVSMQESLQKHQRAQAKPEQVKVWNILASVTAADPLHKKIDSFTTTEYNLCSAPWRKSSPKHCSNKTGGKGRSVASEVLNKLFKTSSPAEREGIKDLTSKQQEQLCKL